MNRISESFVRAKESGCGALLPFLCGGSPEPEALLHLLPAMEHAGASVVEVGFPYSDPISDGPTIAAEMHNALQRGTTPRDIFDQVRQVRPELSIGLVAMVSVTIVTAMGGPEAFISDASDAGFDGLIIPDLPFEESGECRSIAADRGVTISLLISPTTPTSRAIEIANASTGFAYLLARAGVTGARSKLPDISDRVREIRNGSRTPIACGFGISDSEQVAEVVRHADGAIVGSALVNVISKAFESGQDYTQEAEHFVHELATGLISMDQL